MKKTFLNTKQIAVEQTLAITRTPLYQESEVVLWCLENNQAIKIYKDLLELWQKLSNDQKTIYTWPDKESLNKDAQVDMHRNNPSIILCTLENLEQNVADWEFLRSNKIEFAASQEYNLGDIIKKLVNLGLEREKQVWQNNTFAVRGEMLNIYQNDKLYRLNFDQEKLESIELILQNKNKKLKQIEIWPNKIYRQRQFVKTIPPKTLIVTDSYSAELLEHLENKAIIFDPLKKTNYPLDVEYLPNLWKNQSAKIEFIKNYKNIWLSKNKAAAQKIIQDNKLEAEIINWSHALKWPAMIIDKTNKQAIINDTLFFLTDEGLQEKRTRHKFLPNFHIGDIVVHRDHGIARLTDIKTMPIDGEKKQFLELSYADNDTLFVPIELTDKVEKYIGPQEPKINKLAAGNTWPQTLRKIKAHTLELAHKLLNIEATRRLHKSPSIQISDIENDIVKDTPFELTNSQKRAIKEVLSDLNNPHPSDRLICGDVGFGKTEVAIRAAARTVLNGWQVALLCPTTILAQQHYDTIVNRLSKFGINIGLLTRWQNKTEINKTIKEAKDGKIDIIIGTHRILSKDINIPKLQLLIIDEEQNFGVEDKEKLKKHKSNINVLTLSATPIPRTLNMALSSIKDISLITDPIHDRKNIITEIHQTSDEIISQAIQKELDRKGQVYFLHNRVETIQFAAKKIKKLFPKNKIAIAHGQLTDKELADTMHDFDTGKIDILICSTIIANGLDIPKANTLIITEADKFGLSQLHQLRGRIGRSNIQAYAYFLYTPKKLKNIASQRLAHLKSASALGDGFKIAHKDLELRGVGQILGKAQSGKVKSIGLGMYQQLISETIAEIKGQAPNIWRDIDIKLDVDTELPDKLFGDVKEKLNFYQKINRIQDLEIINKEIKKASIESLQNILWLQKLRILIQNTDISRITQYKSGSKSMLAIDFKEALDYKKIHLLLDHNANWKDSEQQIKINMEYITKNFKNELEKVIAIWQ